MASIRRRRILSRSSMGIDSGTYPLRLPRSSPLLGLWVIVEMTNGATSTKDQSVYDEIDNISVRVNGSRVIYSLTGQQARLWTHVMMKKRPNYIRDETPAVVQSALIYIPFSLGRWDMNHYFNPSAYSDLELLITISPTIASTGFATGGNYVTVYADLWEEGTPGVNEGFLRIVEQYAFTSLASGDTQIELPLGNPYLAMGIYALESGVSPETNISQLELDVNDRQSILAEGAWNDLNQLYSMELGIDPDEHGIVYKSDTDVIETWTGDVKFCGLVTPQNLTIGTTDFTRDTIGSIAGGAVTLQTTLQDAAVTAADAASTTDRSIYWFARAAYGLGNFLVIPFGLPNYPANALSTAQLRRLRLTLTNANAGASVKVSTMEIVQTI